MKILKLNLTVKILIGLVLGVIGGMVVYYLKGDAQTWATKYITNGFFKLVGDGFLGFIKMIVVPLVFFSIANGTCGMEDTTKVGRIGIKTLAFYLVTTVLAIAIAIGIALLFGPGNGFNSSILDGGGWKQPDGFNKLGFVDYILSLIPTNPFKSLTNGDMLPIIIFAMIFGLAIAKTAVNSTMKNFISEGNEVMIKLVWMIMSFAPIGVFAMTGRAFARGGFDLFAPLGMYMLCIIIALVIQATIVYPSLLVLLAKLNPVRFFKNFYKAILMAFSSASSSSTVPVSLACLEEDCGVDKDIAGFTIPLGATVNMDGTSIMQGVAAIFLLQAYGVPFGLQEILLIIGMATIASIGSAGVPSAGLVMLSMVLVQLGLPVEGIGILLGVDRLLDMMRTAVNVTGDAVCTCIIAKSEGGLDVAKFNADKND